MLFEQHVVVLQPVPKPQMGLSARVPSVHTQILRLFSISWLKKNDLIVSSSLGWAADKVDSV